MKKLLLIAIASLSGLGAFAQSAYSVKNTQNTRDNHINVAGRNARTTSTEYLDSLLITDGATTVDSITYIYGNNADSGFVNGMNAFNFSAFAQRYDLSISNDSAVQVIGVAGVFSGVVNPASVNTATFKAWTMGPEVGSPTYAYTGFPDTVLDSVVVPFTSLGISDTAYNLVNFFFTTPTSYLTTSFFVGYSLNYTWGLNAGDTIYATATSYTYETPDTISGGDTLLNVQNATYIPGTGWVDDFDYFGGLYQEFLLFPIVNVYQSTTGVKGITKNGFTFYGNYPNPATDNTNIKFSLANNEDVTITISDMAGHAITTINKTNLPAGVNIIPVATSTFAAGDYIYLVRTASGNGMAAKMTVIK